MNDYKNVIEILEELKIKFPTDWVQLRNQAIAILRNCEDDSILQHFTKLTTFNIYTDLQEKYPKTVRALDVAITGFKTKGLVNPNKKTALVTEFDKKAVFIGHGRSKLWARLQVFLKDDLKLDTFTFESESHASESIVEVLNGFLSSSSFAILILTAEDETADGKFRARQNVVHEAGLFQGRIGFDKVVLLKQDTVEEFSNLAGLQYISFHEENIEHTFYELQRKMRKSGLVK